MSRSRQRILAVLLATLLGALAVLLVLRLRPQRVTSVRLFDNTATVQALLEERARQAAPDSGDPCQIAPLDRTTVEQLWSTGPGGFEYDPQLYYRRQGGLDYFEAWPEHAGGGFRCRTSPEGWREDWDVMPDHHDLLVVVTGDSHTDGMCENSESFANRLEAALRERHPGRAIEVLNTGLTGYSFYNYLGALQKLLPLHPDAFVVATYGGNDFLDMLKPWHCLHNTAPPPRSPEFWRRLHEAESVSGNAVAQALNQLLYFQSYPDQAELAQQAVECVTREIERICREQGIALWYVYIPPGFSTEGELEPTIAEAQRRLQLTNSDLHSYDRLADRLQAQTRTLGIPLVDLRESLRGHVGEYYWKDLHINVRGHQLIADQLLPLVEQRFAARLR